MTEVSDWYILDENHKPRPITDFEEYIAWENSGKDKRRVATDKIAAYSISTVFLGLDHDYTGKRPVLFESMVFLNGKEVAGHTNRYTNWDCAVKGHANIMKKLRSSIDSQEEKVDVE